MEFEVEINLETILAEFSSKKAQGHIIRLAISKGLPVAENLVQQAINAHTWRVFKAEIAEEAGDVQQAQKWYLEEAEECERRQSWGCAAEYAEKAGFKEKAQILYEKAISTLLEKGDIEEAGDMAINVGDGIKVQQIYERAITNHLKEKEFREAAEVALKLGNKQRAVDFYVRGEKYDYGAKVSQLMGKEDEALKLYRKQIAYLTHKNWDLSKQVQIAQMIGDLELAIKIALNQEDFDKAAELAVSDNQLEKVGEIFEAGINHYERKANTYLSEIENPNLIQAFKKSVINFKRKRLWKKHSESPISPFISEQLMDETSKFILEEKAQPSYAQVAYFLSQAGKLAEKKGEQERAVEFYKQALDYYKKVKDWSEAAKISKKIGDKMNFGWAYLKVVDGFKEQAKQFPASFHLAAEFAYELGEFDDAINYCKCEGNYNGAAKIALERGDEEMALNCYLEAEYLSHDMYPAVELALKMGQKDKAEIIFRKTVEKNLEGSAIHLIPRANLALKLGINDIARQSYDKMIKNKFTGDFPNFDKADEIAEIAEVLGDTERAKIYRALAKLQSTSNDQSQTEPNFFRETNPNEPFDVRGMESIIRGKLYFYETKIKPLMV